MNALTFLVGFSSIQTIVFVYYLINNNGNRPAPMLTYSNDLLVKQNVVKCAESKSKLTKLFHRIGDSFGIDKIYHRYYNLYGMYLGPVRHRPLNFLEIGLGCTMKYGPGKSLLAWRQYLTHPDTNISFVEFNRKCAEKFRKSVHNLFIGDQSDFRFLETVGRNGGPYDFIVDDGGHKRSFQVRIFIHK